MTTHRVTREEWCVFPFARVFMPMVDTRNLRLSSAGLTGSLPDAMSAMTSFTSLYISSNALNGTLPANFSAWTNLRCEHYALMAGGGGGFEKYSPVVFVFNRVLQMRSNQLVGSLPSTYSSLTELSQVFLTGNKLNGSIPSSFGALTAMQYVALSLGCRCVVQ